MLHTSSSHSSRTPLLSRQELALIAVTMVWGGTFLVVHLAMQHSGPLFFVGLRFVTAGLFGVLVVRQVLGRRTRTQPGGGSALRPRNLLRHGPPTLRPPTLHRSQARSGEHTTG